MPIGLGLVIRSCYGLEKGHLGLSIVFREIGKEMGCCFGLLKMGKNVIMAFVQLVFGFDDVYTFQV